MRRAFLAKFAIAVVLFTAASVRCHAQLGCSDNGGSTVPCCGKQYDIEPPGDGAGANAYMYQLVYCCGGSSYLPLYEGNCLYAFKNRPELLDRMLKRFPDQTFLTAACSGDLVSLSSAPLAGSRTEKFPLRLCEKLHLE